MVRSIEVLQRCLGGRTGEFNANGEVHVEVEGWALRWRRPRRRFAPRATARASGWTAAVDGAGLALAGSAVLAVRGLPAWEARAVPSRQPHPGMGHDRVLGTDAGWRGGRPPRDRRGPGPAPRGPSVGAGRGAGGGGGAWLTAKVAKHLVGRGRPATHLREVAVRAGGTNNGRGYVSGHAAVATALAATLSPRLPARGRVAAAALVAVVGFARIQNGSHLPLDVIGGAGLGLLVGALGPRGGPVGAA